MQPINPYAPPHEPEPIGAGPQRLITLGDILLKGTTLYVNHAQAMIGVTLIVCGPLELFRTYHHYFIADLDEAGRWFRVDWFVEELVRLVAFGGFIAIGDAAMKGQRPTVWNGLRGGLEAWPRVVAAEIVVGVTTLLGLMALIVPGIYVMARSALAGQAAVIERRGGMASMRRSFELTQGQSWRYLALLAILLAVMVCCQRSGRAADDALSRAEPLACCGELIAADRRGFWLAATGARRGLLVEREATKRAERITEALKRGKQLFGSPLAYASGSCESVGQLWTREPPSNISVESLVAQ